MDTENFAVNEKLLMKLVKTKMPFGKYKDQMLTDLPLPYLIWFARKGFPEGELGQLLQVLHEIKSEGLEFLLGPLPTE